MERARGPKPPPPPRVSAEQLYADALERDNAEWLTFNIKEMGWRSRQRGELRNWLEQNKPSKVLRADGIGWIAVSCRSDAEDDLSEGELSDEEEEEGDAKAEWEALEHGCIFLQEILIFPRS